MLRNAKFILFWSVIFGAGSAVAAAASMAPENPPIATVPAAKTSNIAQTYGKLPLGFEANRGQADGRIKFLARGIGYGIFLTKREADLELHGAPLEAQRVGASPWERSHPRLSIETEVVRMRLSGADPKTSATGIDPLPGTANYFVGKDSSKWRSGIPVYSKVRFSNVYRGVDLIYYGNQGQLEYDFVVRPGADTKAIRLSFSGTRKLALTADGGLSIDARNGRILFRSPEIYQEANGRRVPVQGCFSLHADRSVGFRLAAYDHSQPLIIDPVLSYSTYLGGSHDDAASSIAIDGSGNAYVTGTTFSTDFPVTPGAYHATDKSGTKYTTGFVSKMNATGTALIYSTYLGGSGGETASGIALDSAGNAYVAGMTGSKDFPVTKGAFQTKDNSATGRGTGFVSKLNASGTQVLYSTYLGGSNYDQPVDVKVNSSGIAYVTGWTQSTDFPTTAGAFQTVKPGSSNTPFVTCLNAGGTALVYSTYLGGNGDDQAGSVVLDSAGNAYIAGSASSIDFPVTPGAFQMANKAIPGHSTVFVAKLNSSGSSLVYATYLGGSTSDTGGPIAVDGDGNAYVAGTTNSIDFPVTAGAFQTSNFESFHENSTAFVASLNPEGTALRYSTYLGGSGLIVGGGGDSANAIAVDSAGDAYVAGWTASSDFPWTAGAFQTTVGNINGNAFVTELNPEGDATLYSTYLGGSGGRFGGDSAAAIVTDGAGNVYITGSSDSLNFPVTAGAFQSTNHSATNNGNAFISKLDLNDAPSSIPTTITLNTTINPQIQGQSGEIAVTVASLDSSEVPTGNVSFILNDELMATVPLDGTGKASFSTANLAVGWYEVYTVYGGGGSFDPNKAELIETVTSANAVNFSPPPGKFNGMVTVSMSDINPNATIHYTLDGSDPTPSSPVYGRPITVTASTLFKAIGTSSQFPPSPFVQSFYTVVMQTPTPVISPAPGSYSLGQPITITDADSTATIRYTTDGSTPTTTSNWYHEPILLTGSETIQSIAISTGRATSNVTSASYTVP